MSKSSSVEDVYDPRHSRSDDDDTSSNGGAVWGTLFSVKISVNETVAETQKKETRKMKGSAKANTSKSSHQCQKTDPPNHIERHEPRQ